MAVVPGGAGHRRWAWIPASALVVLAILIALGAAALLAAFDHLWRLALIAAGAFLLWRAVPPPPTGRVPDCELVWGVCRAFGHPSVGPLFALLRSSGFRSGSTG